MEEGKYVKVPKIYKKIQLAEKMEVPIYISGAVGYGKTAAMEYYYRKQAHLVLSGEPGFFPDMPEPWEIRQRVVVFDDISWITDEVSQNYVKDLIRNRKKWEKQIVLIGRSPLPPWLRVLSIEEDFVTAGEQDLMFTEKETKVYLEKNGVELSEKDVLNILEETFGYPLTLNFLVYRIKNKMSVNLECDKSEKGYESSDLQQIELDMFRYYDHALYEKWDVPMREMLMAMCQYPSFTIPMIEMITSCSQVPQLLEQAMAVGTFLTKLDNETYSYRYHLRQYMKWKQSVTYTPEMMKENYNRGAHYYEMTNQIQLALEYYTRAGNEERIVELLIENAGKQPGLAHFFETRKYYFALPEETVLKHPALICGMSLLHGMMMHPEQSDAWYNRLVEFEKNDRYDSQERREAAIRVAYLDIAMAQKGTKGVLKKIMSGASLCMNRKIQLPDFAVTGNAPSIINGGLDFCEWTRKDKEIAVMIKKPLEVLLGRYGIGLINIALTESGLEKGTMDPYEIMTRLNNGYHVSDVGGRIEISFVAMGLMVKEYILQGQPSQAEALYETFYQKVVDEKENHLIPNLKALHVWMHLLGGSLQKVEQWLAKAPNDMLAFCILDRYQYIHKVRVLIALDKKEEALSLVERIQIYFTQYKRHYLWIENQVLKSILLYRMGNENWKDVLKQVLVKAGRYHFVPVIALEGVALKPLLDRMEEQDIEGIDREYFHEVKVLNKKIASYYPNYLKAQRGLEEPLTESEQRILKLMCSGMSSKEICEQSHITYNGYKFHVHNIYRKMKVKNRGEAERLAARLGIDR